MSSWLDSTIAVSVWLAGFAWVARAGSWLPLAAGAIAAAGRLVSTDHQTRRLLALQASDVLLGIVAGSVMTGATYAIYGPLAQVFPGLVSRTAALYRVLAADRYPLPVLAGLILIVSACEEIVWRGRLLSGASEATRERGWPRASDVRQALGHAALYAAAHATSRSLLLVGVALVCGFAWGLLRLASRSLWPPLLTHALWDLSVLVLWPLA